MKALVPTDFEGIFRTSDGEFLMEESSGEFVLLKRHLVSFENRSLLQAQLDALDIPDDLKQSVIDKYNDLQAKSCTDGVEVSIYEGVDRLNSHGRSIIDDLPDIYYEGRKFRYYTVTYENIAIRETISAGDDVVQFMDNATSITLAVFGLLPNLTPTQLTVLGVLGAGMTLLDLLEETNDGSITGHFEDEYWIDGNYSTITKHYYIYSDMLDSWNKALDTQLVQIHVINFTAQVQVEYVDDYGNIKIKRIPTDLGTLASKVLKTPSYDDPFPVALQYQFMPLTEWISFEYEGFTFEF